MRHLLAGFILLAVPIVCHGQEAEVPEATVCEILANPVGYSGRVVRVRGHVEMGEAGFRLTDECCKGPYTLIPLAYPDNPHIEPQVTFQLNRDHNFKVFNKYLTAKSTVTTWYRVVATITGRLDAIGKEELGAPPGLGKGFGHLKNLPARLVIESVGDVEVTKMTLIVPGQ